jgi:hypothetical protein
VRGLGALLLVGSVCCAQRAAAADPTPKGVYWQPQGAAAVGDAARAAFVRVLAARGITVETLSGAPPVTPSPAPALAAALADFAAFHFADAQAKLTELQRVVEASGGGDLDARQLSELYLYRGLARVELGQADQAWDDFVRAARLDATRVLDAAQFPPRVVASYRRAVADAALVPRAELALELPDGAEVRLDGRAAPASGSVALGAHLLRVEAPGFLPWAGSITVTSAQERFHPPLQPLEPPAVGELAAAAHAGPTPLVIGVLARGPAGWRFVARRHDPYSGRTSTVEQSIDATGASRTVESLLAQLLDPAPLLHEPQVVAKPKRRVPWWVWVAAGGVAAALAVAIPVGIVYSQPTPSVGGSVGLR